MKEDEDVYRILFNEVDSNEDEQFEEEINSLDDDLEEIFFDDEENDEPL